MKVAQLDQDGFYLGESEDYGGPMPHGCIADFPPNKALPEFHRWRWNGKEYEAPPDYRGKFVYRPDGTTYYPDTWGPLPEEDSLDAPPPPEPTEAELCALRIAEIKSELQAIDTAKVRPMSAIVEGAATDDEHTRLAELNAHADALRAEMQMLEAFV